MSQIIETFERWLETEQRPYCFDGEHLNFEVCDPWGRWLCLVWASDDDDFVTIRGCLPLNVPEESRSRVAEYLTRLNWGLPLGLFVMDFSDGEVRYRIVAPVNGELSSSWVGKLMDAVLFTVQNYSPELLKVALGDCDPVEAFRRAEAWRSEASESDEVEPEPPDAGSEHRPPVAARGLRRRR